MTHTCDPTDPATRGDCERCLADYAADVIDDRREHQERDEQ